MTLSVVNPVTVPVGSTVHLTPVDQNGNPIPIAQCTIVAAPGAPLNPSIFTIAYDSTGANFTGVAPGSILCLWVAQAPNGGTTVVNSANFEVVVPWDVTAVYDTQP